MWTDPPPSNQRHGLPRAPLRVARRVARDLVAAHLTRDPAPEALAALRGALVELGAAPAVARLDALASADPIDRGAIYALAYELVHELPSHEPTLDALLRLLADPNTEQRPLLALLERAWIERLRAMDPEDRADAAARIKRRIKSPKLKGPTEALVERVLG